MKVIPALAVAAAAATFQFAAPSTAFATDAPAFPSCSAINGTILTLSDPLRVTLQPGETLTLEGNRPEIVFFEDGAAGRPAMLVPPFVIDATVQTSVSGLFAVRLSSGMPGGMPGGMPTGTAPTYPSDMPGSPGSRDMYGETGMDEGGPIGSGFPPIDPSAFRITVTCLSGTVPGSTVLSNLGATSQSAAIQSGLGYAFGARENGGGGGFISSQGNFFGTTARPGDDWVAWSYAQLRNFSGGTDGYGVEIVAGIDKRLSPGTYVGALIALGYVDIETSATTSDNATSIAVGPYFGTNYRGLFIDGWLTYAEPDYDVDGAKFSSERVSLGLQVAGEINTPSVTYRPFLRLRAYEENVPAYTGTSGTAVAEDVTRTELSLGSRIEWLWGAVPNGRLYASGALDFVSIDSSVTGTNDFVSPRLGLGFSQVRPSGAVISIDIDAGEVIEDTYDFGVLFKYTFGF